MSVAVAFHNDRNGACRALTVLSIKRPTANVLGVRRKTLSFGHDSLFIRGEEALWTWGAGDASGKMVPWGQLGWFIIVAVSP